MSVAQIALVYDVLVEHTTLTLLNPGKGITRYAVHLNGSIDERWVEAYQIERRLSRKLSRFELEPSTATVWFTRDPGTDPADVIDALDMLDALVAHVNERASYATR